MSLFEENAWVLQDLEAKGSDLGPPRLIDFSHIFPHEASANAFARDAQQDGFSIAIQEVDREDAPWDVTASKEMVPTCENITGTEACLDALARSYQGRADGWGFFRV
ncbi:ribonuclease E inhibitor RraB [Sphingobium sp. MK2]|uniref:ribonuclease E inhibitor RraB n=1 Tax=Sphingobium sp. MK2 TaxID=3116540 RepID=UPI0032E35D8B